MSEIEKMYENAGIDKNCHANIKFDDCIYSPSDCGYYNYPDFTTEKQIELIKWLGKNKKGFGFFNDGTEGLSCHCDFHWEWFREDSYAEDFENALAGLINQVWQSITEEEKQQIKEILE